MLEDGVNEVVPIDDQYLRRLRKMIKNATVAAG